MACLKGVEPLTHSLEGCCSILLSYRHKTRCEKNGAGDGNRTHAASLEGWNSTIELHPHFNSTLMNYSKITFYCQQYLYIYLNYFYYFIRAFFAVYQKITVALYG